MFSKSCLLAASLALVAQAHLFIYHPAPITPSNNVKDPLNADGSNFPCHGQALNPNAPNGIPGTNNLDASQKQQLAIDIGGANGQGENSAVHGGGSCQLSLTYETDPQKVKDPSNWHVIYSVLGGCPAIWDDNLVTGSVSYCATNGDTQCMNNYTYSIPDQVPNGPATFAWTWSNTLGNREYYMSCAYVNIQNAKAKDQSQLSSLPQLYVGNTQNINGVSNCQNAASANVQYPNPGTNTFSNTANPTAPKSASFPMKTPSGNCGPTSGSGGDQGPAPTGASPPAGAQPSGASASYSVPAATSTSGSASGSGASSIPSPAPYSGGGGAGNGSCNGGAQSCSNPGAVVCMGSTQFGICDIDGCATAQDVAAGTTCQGGVVSRMKKLGKRGHGPSRHAHGHFNLLPWMS